MYVMMTETQYHFTHTIIFREITLGKPPLWSHPLDFPLSCINFENNNLALHALFLWVFLLSDFSLFRLPLRRLMRFSFSSLLFLHAVMVLTFDGIREILLRLSASSVLAPLFVLSVKHERADGREKEEEKETCEVLTDSLQVSEEQGLSRRGCTS